MFRFQVLVLTLHCLQQREASADFELRIFTTPSASFTAGTPNNVLSVYAYTVDAPDSGRFLNEFTFGFDFGSLGVGGVSPDFTITGVSGNANFSVGSPQTFGDADNFDFLVTGSAVNTDTVDMSSFTSATPDVG